MNLKRALIVWLGIAVAETIHGTLRAIFLVPVVGDLPSRQIGVLTGSIIIFIISLIAIRWIGAVTFRQQLQVGALWVILTIIFEVSLGLALGFSLERILADYNLAAGGYMPLGLLFMLFSPTLAAKARGSKKRNKMKKVLLLLAEGFETYEASVFIDVIGWNFIDGDHTTKLFSGGMQREIKSSFDQRFIADYLIEEINVADFDALAIPGGFEEYGFYKDAYSEPFIGIIREFHRQNKIIASVCVAALSLGKSGILAGKKATTYNQKPIRQETLKNFEAEIINRPVVIDQNIITSWNPSAAMDVAFTLLEMLTTKENARYIKKIMGFDEKDHST